ncbi:hypothetical protein MTO96_004246 [Rhipicephalus appendiculatus]
MVTQCPPDIVGSESSSDVLVREGSNVTLSCRAKGYPAPRITWRREDGTPIAVGNWQEQLGSTATDNVSYEGEELSITKVSRLHMGPYLCIASNGVPSPVSRRILLQVHFPPMIWIPNQLIGAPLGGEVVMDCNTEAFPMSNQLLDPGERRPHRRVGEVLPQPHGEQIHIPPPPKVKEPSTARIQSIEESKMEVPRDSITKQRSYPARPPLTGSPAKTQDPTDASRCPGGNVALMSICLVATARLFT